jgi:hypothetical protein
LRELGFAYDELTTSNLNSGIDLSQYDVLIQSKKGWLNYLNNNGKSTLKNFIEAGGDFIGASLDDGDFFVSGYWPDWKDSNADGKPIIVRGEENSRDITLIGSDPTFRGHPRNDFRIIGNAIYSGLE